MSSRVKYTVQEGCEGWKQESKAKRLEDIDTENMQDFGVGVKATCRI